MDLFANAHLNESTEAICAACSALMTPSLVIAASPIIYVCDCRAEWKCQSNVLWPLNKLGVDAITPDEDGLGVLDEHLLATLVAGGKKQFLR